MLRAHTNSLTISFLGRRQGDVGGSRQSRNQGLDPDWGQERDGDQHLIVVWTLSAKHAAAGQYP